MLNAETRARYHRGLGRVFSSAGQAVLIAVASRASIAPGSSPFAIACFTAGLYMGFDYRALLIGCVLGIRWERFSFGETGTAVACLTAFSIWALIGYITREKKAFYSYIEDVSPGVLAAGTAMIPGLISGYIANGGIVTAIACCLIAQAITPVIMCARDVNFRRAALLGEERLAVCAVILIFVFGVSSSPLSFLVGPITAFITLLASYSGAGAGAAAGAVAGAAMTIAAKEVGLSTTLALTGFIAGLTLPLGRGWSSAAFVLSNVIVSMYSGEWAVSSVSPASCIAACVVYSLIDEDLIERLAGWIAPGVSAPDIGHLASRLRQATRNRLSALEKVFETLSDGYGDFPVYADERTMTDKLRKVLCEGCPVYEDCWNGNADRAGRLLCGFLASALKGDEMRETDELPPEVARECRRAAIIPRKLSPVLNEFCQTRKRYSQNRTCAATLARHFSSAKNILSEMCDNLDSPMHVDEDMCSTAVAALEKEGFGDARVIVLSGDNVELTATRDEIWLEDEARQAQIALSKALSLPLRAAFSRGGDVTLRLVRAPKLSANVGYACRPLSSTAPCGDSYVATGLNAGRVLIALSDGMGTGARAAGESARTVELIRRFLQADIDDKLTLDAINQLLLLRDDEEMFATADICVIDLNEASARFIKQGACASYIIKDDDVEVIEGGRLPLGILDEVCPSSSDITLESGDIIVMLTDGVCDEANDGENEWLRETLLSLANETTDVICRELIVAARARHEVAPDDMTAIAVSIS